MVRPQIVVLFLLAGCSYYDGLYSPACPAYAGDTIKLGEGDFVWEKFTDEVIVDDDGEVENQFPGYPMRGTYRVEGRTVSFKSASGDALENMHLQQCNNRHYLLTKEQFEAYKKTGECAECALVLGGTS